MAKKKFDSATFVAELLDGIEGLTDEQKTNLTTLVTGNEKLASKLGESVMRQSDYSKEMDALKKQAEEIQNYRSTLEQWRQENEQVVLNSKAEAEAYKQRLMQEGILSTSNVEPPKADYLTKKDWETAASQLQNQGINVMAKLTKLAVSHLNKFKEELDTDALVKASIEQNLPLDIAYERMKAPMEQKLQEQKFEQKLKEAREEGMRQAYSNSNFPTDHTLSRDPHPLEYAEAASKDSTIKVGWKAAAEAHLADRQAGRTPTS